jgi:hypothetical protein
MSGSGIFISSCSRRQLARRRPARLSARVQVLVVLLVLAFLASVAFVAGRGGI